MQVGNIYHLEILIDTLKMLDAENPKAEKMYNDLKEEALEIQNNLIRAINMEITDDIKLLKTLVDNLDRAYEMDMRGELIDFARTFKRLCSQLL